MFVVVCVVLLLLVGRVKPEQIGQSFLPQAHEGRRSGETTHRDLDGSRARWSPDCFCLDESLGRQPRSLKHSQKRQHRRDHGSREKLVPQDMAGKHELPHLIWRSTTPSFRFSTAGCQVAYNRFQVSTFAGPGCKFAGSGNA